MKESLDLRKERIKVEAALYRIVLSEVPIFKECEDRKVKLLDPKYKGIVLREDAGQLLDLLAMETALFFESYQHLHKTADEIRSSVKSLPVNLHKYKRLFIASGVKGKTLEATLSKISGWVDKVMTHHPIISKLSSVPDRDYTRISIISPWSITTPLPPKTKGGQIPQRELVESLFSVFKENFPMSGVKIFRSIALILKHLELEDGGIDQITTRISQYRTRKKRASTQK